MVRIKTETKRTSNVSGSKRWRAETVHKGRNQLTTWYCEVKGARPGPTMAVIAGQHGMEPAGPAMLAAFLADLDADRLRGTLRAVPCANAEALRGGFECDVPPAVMEKARRRGTPWGGCPFGLNRQTCGRNLNRCWPGNPKGNIHDRLAAAMWESVVAGADYVIDFHCWQDTGPAGVIAYDDDAIAFGRWFGIPHLHRYPLSDHSGILALAALRAGMTALTVELAPQRRINAGQVEIGRLGLENLMRRAGMLPGRPRKPPKQYLFEYARGDRRPVRLPWDALVYPKDTPGRWYRKGEEIGDAVRLDRPQTVRTLRAPCDGILIAQAAWAMIARGRSAFTFYRARPLPAAEP